MDDPNAYDYGGYPDWISPEERSMWDAVPMHDHGGLHRFIEYGVEPGNFLCAVLDNDLREAFGRADEENIAAMFHIVKFLWNVAPAPAWGSRERRLAWQAAGGLRGHRR